MIKKTEDSYKKLAAYFYKHHMDGGELSVTTIAQALTRLAPTFTPGYFRRLKNAIAFDLSERGYSSAAEEVKALVNPVTAPGSEMPQKPKRPKAKSFSDDEFRAFVNQLAGGGHHAVWAAVSLIRFTGARPEELKTIKIVDGVVVILGAKKSHQGQRGADRLLSVDDDNVSSLIANCIHILKQSDMSMDAIRHRLRKEGQQLWKRRKVIPSMYSMRHQFGSNLKSSGSDARTIAYIMGHQSTSSVAVYGGRRPGDPAAIKVSPAQGAKLEPIRKKVSPQKMRRFEAMIYKSESEHSK